MSAAQTRVYRSGVLGSGGVPGADLSAYRAAPATGLVEAWSGPVEEVRNPEPLTMYRVYGGDARQLWLLELAEGTDGAAGVPAVRASSTEVRDRLAAAFVHLA